MSNLPDDMKDVRAEDLEGDVAEVYSVLSQEIADEDEALRLTLALASHLSGCELYFRKVEKLLKKARDRRIREQHNGQNTRELARQEKLSTSYIRQLAFFTTEED